MVGGLLKPLGFLAILGFPLEPALPSIEEVEAERVVVAAGFKTDADSLLAFFKKRTLTDADRLQLANLVRQLGDSSYEVRTLATLELIAQGNNALRFLKPALTDPDLEIARRAERCLEAIQRGTGPMLPIAAARLLGMRKPPGATEVLLAYVPFADDESVEEAVVKALLDVAIVSGKGNPALVTALVDSEPARRGAAGFVLGQVPDPQQRHPVISLLGDPVVKVRFQGAQALFASGEKAAVPALIALLTDGSPELAWQAEEMLCRLAGDSRPKAFLDLSGDEPRRKTRSAWEAWWKVEEPKFDPARIKMEPRLLGLTLIADLDKGLVQEFGLDHKERWQIGGFKGPVDVQVLPNGNVLVAENHGKKVTEKNRLGKTVWEKSTSSLPASCQRLPNGNTFIATYNQIMEVTPDGKEINKISRSEGLYAAQKLRNGHIVLLSTQGRIVTLNSAGEEIKSVAIGPTTSWSSFDILANGHLLACCSPGKVVEFDTAGNRVWDADAPHAVSACRLPDGHTLVCTSENKRIVELDRSGKPVWEQKMEGRP
ncbi:MAG TPA: HEAT repeat domain-containing protein, partial [Gemmataceae bacterium]|nr:HEAT repeat domain-containing protein [Gemmataceae bacterium]